MEPKYSKTVEITYVLEYPQSLWNLPSHGTHTRDQFRSEMQEQLFEVLGRRPRVKYHLSGSCTFVTEKDIDEDLPKMVKEAEKAALAWWVKKTDKPAKI